ncbi:tetratricopeptide repeat protein [Salegentibacter sp. F188]|uniref:Tetratricopeptide repeat protein n=1 Tax=Autumnicola patrickiae TaxID=3075591 RepID=A0ABU3E1U6_9FLAO|nr:tetratricopeptide repeat protein [Salegentibacter sp. F188]MDT0689910.1 tetratricopeptide repeat protein [Salegentibacter sp. F188]
MVKIKLQYLLIFIYLIILGCKETPSSEGPVQKIDLSESEKQRQQEIIEEHLKNGAWKYQIYSQEWQREIDRGLAKDSTIAYLWQQKAMPLIKQGKYEIGLQYLDKAVKYDRRKWQDYRAFTKCIFANTYRDAIEDFVDYKKEYGYGYVMDHSYDFYIALSYLQLNEFEKAEKVFNSDFDYILKEKGEDWLHHLDLFYFGLSKYEQEKYEEAIEIFDLALKIYPEFSDVQIYKAVCLRKLGRPEEAKKFDELAEINGKKGYTINEANAIYERYPYQMRWGN